MILVNQVDLMSPQLCRLSLGRERLGSALSEFCPMLEEEKDLKLLRSPWNRTDGTHVRDATFPPRTMHLIPDSRFLFADCH